MNQCERDLHEALRRREPLPDFAAKVLARTSEAHVPGFFSWRWLAVAASVALMVGGAMLIQEQRQAESEKAEKAEKAKEQLMVAFRITGSKVREIQARLDSIQKRVVYPQLNP